jgi:hypothetical protein
LPNGGLKGERRVARREQGSDRAVLPSGAGRGRQGILQQLFVDGGKRHFPGRLVAMRHTDPLLPLRKTSAFRTEIHELFGEGDRVVARITHFVTYGPGAGYVCQMGTFPCNEQSVQWDATATFRFENGKVAEEWVNRDELAVLRQLGHVGK